MLAFVHAGYWNRQRVWVRHNGIAGVWRIDRRTGQRVFTPISREAAPDYYGCVDGRFVAFDAKTTDHNARWRLDKERAHQYQLMLDLASAGAVCSLTPPLPLSTRSTSGRNWRYSTPICLKKR